MSFWALLGAIGKGAVAAGKGLAGAPQAAGTVGAAGAAGTVGGAGTVGAAAETISTAAKIGHSIGLGLRAKQALEDLSAPGPGTSPTLSSIVDLYGTHQRIRDRFGSEPRAGPGDKYSRLSIDPRPFSPASVLGKTADPRYLLEQMDQFNIDWPD